MTTEERIEDIVRGAISRRETPGAVVGLVDRDGSRKVLAFGGQTYDPLAPRVTAETVYDVASVTKSIPGAMILLALIDSGKLSLTDRVVDYIPEFANGPGKEQVTIKHLLTFTLDLKLPALNTLAEKSPEEILRTVVEAPLASPPGAKFIYANATALFFHLIAERITRKKLDVLAEEMFFRPLGLRDTTFHPEDLSIERIAPTEVTPLRGEVRGFVHDESSYALRPIGPVAIAGLFSTVPDTLRVLEIFLHGGTFQEKKYFSEDIIAEISRNHTPELPTAQGLGSELDQEWMGRERKHIFGKRGFTGTSVMVHKQKGRALAIFSNATYPTRPPDYDSRHNLRIAIADAVFASH